MSKKPSKKQLLAISKHVEEEDAKLLAELAEDVLAAPSNRVSIIGCSIVRSFDIYAERHQAVVSDYDQLRSQYVPALERVSKRLFAVIELLVRRHGADFWPENTKQPFLDSLQVRLSGRVLFWKGATMQRIRESIRDTPEAKSTIPVKQAPRHGYRDQVRAWMKEKEIKNIREAAKHLGVSISTLKSIMSNKGERRYGEDTLAAVLAKTGFKGGETSPLGE
jgi:hypothetical protein